MSIPIWITTISENETSWWVCVRILCLCPHLYHRFCPWTQKQQFYNMHPNKIGNLCLQTITPRTRDTKPSTMNSSTIKLDLGSLVTRPTHNTPWKNTWPLAFYHRYTKRASFCHRPSEGLRQLRWPRFFPRTRYIISHYRGPFSLVSLIAESGPDKDGEIGRGRKDNAPFVKPNAFVITPFVPWAVAGFKNKFAKCSTLKCIKRGCGCRLRPFVSFDCINLWNLST